MNQPLTGPKNGKPRVLVAPLDWGLGHATRCIPIIRELMARDCDVWLAGEGAQEMLLKAEFPGLPFLQLQGYRINYAKSARGLLWSILRQSGKIISSVRNENKWLNDMVKKYSFDAVISDNRYGLYHASVHSVFITHQLTIKSPLGKWSEQLLQRKNYSYINRFERCWIPDLEGEDNIAGELSHPAKMPAIPVEYTGPLSRLTKKDQAETPGHLLVLLSGPEPQRTILENIMVNELSGFSGMATVVRGLPGAASVIPSTNRISFYNHLPAGELNIEMQNAEYIIARSGYSTVMDIAALQKKSILIPTPGQTEQEYLATYLSAKRFAPFVLQDKFSLPAVLAVAANFPYLFFETTGNSRLQKAVSSLVNFLQNK